RTLLDDFAPELGDLVCGPLEMEPAYERFWEPETRALMRDWAVQQASRAQEQSRPPCATRLHAAEQALIQRLQECTQALVVRGGPSLLVGRYIQHYHTIKELFYGEGPSMLPHGTEPYYPLAAVLALFGDGYDLNLLQEDWEEALGMEGPLPLYLH